ncbi:MAG: SDR family NAD(P)-dependent oxidoreductase [Pseudomonadota bacterium]
MGRFTGKKVLVTGAAGFIGSHLTEALVREGADVRAFYHYNALDQRGWLDQSDVKSELEYFSGDIGDANAVREAVRDRDIVFHLAALIGIPYSYYAPASYVRTNINGTLNVVQAAREFDIERVLHTSTSEVYGTALTAPITEEHPLQGQSPYSASKIGADKIAESYYLSFGTPVIVCRPFNTFGPRQSARAVIPTIITQALAGRDIKLGALHPTRDLNYVANTAEGFMAAALGSEKALGESINFGFGEEISIGDLAKMIVEIVGADCEISSTSERLRPEKSEVERLIAGNAKARELLGWEPQIGLREGLEKTVDWFRGNLDRYRVGEYTV